MPFGNLFPCLTRWDLLLYSCDRFFAGRRRLVLGHHRLTQCAMLAGGREKAREHISLALTSSHHLIEFIKKHEDPFGRSEHSENSIRFRVDAVHTLFEELGSID